MATARTITAPKAPIHIGSVSIGGQTHNVVPHPEYVRFFFDLLRRVGGPTGGIVDDIARQRAQQALDSIGLAFLAGEPGEEGPMGPRGLTGPAGSGGSGTAILDFGSGAPMATVAVTGQAALLAGSLVYCWIKPEATADHSEHEHIVESIKVVAADIVAGVGFTIWGLCPDPAIAPAGPDLARLGRFSGAGTAPGAGQAARDKPNPLNRTALLQGKWTVGWFYTQ